MTIHLIPALPTGSSDLPGNSGGPPSSVPLFGLAPGGVCQAPAVASGAGELLPHPFTLTGHSVARAPGGFLSVALSFPLPGLGVAQRLVLWSPDFPPPCLGTGQRPFILLWQKGRRKAQGTGSADRKPYFSMRALRRLPPVDSAHHRPNR